MFSCEKLSNKGKHGIGFYKIDRIVCVYEVVGRVFWLTTYLITCKDCI